MALRGTKPDTSGGFAPSFVPPREHILTAERIQRLDGALSAVPLHADFMDALRRRAATLNTHATTSIEGNPLLEADVARIADKPSRARNVPDEIEVANHLRYYARVSRSPSPTAINADEILRTHAELLFGVLSQGLGAWKATPNVISADEGREVFYPAPPTKVAAQVDALLRWSDATTLPTPIHAAVWVHEFLSIHPFRDGNGRVARALTHRLLLSSGLRGMKYVALDARFLADRRSYMEAIRAVQSAEWDHAPWVAYFLQQLEAAYQEARAAVTGKVIVAGQVDGLQRQILEWVLQRGSSTFRRGDVLATPFARQLHDVTVSNALSALAGAGFLEAMGSGKGRRYQPGPKFRELLERHEARER